MDQISKNELLEHRLQSTARENETIGIILMMQDSFAHSLRSHLMFLGWSDSEATQICLQRLSLISQEMAEELVS